MNNFFNDIKTMSFVDISNNTTFDVFPEIINIDPVLSIGTNMTWDYESKFILQTCEATNKIYDLLNNDHKDCNVVLAMPSLIQTKTHKKKRINKKWLKRYGYKTVYMKENNKTLKNATITNNQDGSYSVSGDLII